jgi:hypothetical protein
MRSGNNLASTCTLLGFQKNEYKLIKRIIIEYVVFVHQEELQRCRITLFISNSQLPLNHAEINL